MERRYGSDLVVAGLEQLGFPFVSLNPGASFRGIHDSLVHAGRPELVLTLAENVTIAVAHGYAKATGRPMAAMVHNVVGLQNASMALFNAWIDQVPMVVIGGSGPADHARRRPWIDWIHTAKPQGAVVRDIVKWDDEPRSLPGIPMALERAYGLATTAPQGPTYLAMDALLQEEPVPDGFDARVRAPAPSELACAPAQLEQLASRLLAAEHPVILADTAGRSQAAYDALQRLADALAAPVVDLGGRHNFPTDHPLDAALGRDLVLADADVVLAVDVRDLRWAIATADLHDHSSRSVLRPGTSVLSIGLTDLLHSGMFDREEPVHAEIRAIADSAVVLPLLADEVERRAGDVRSRLDAVGSSIAALKARVARENDAASGRLTETTLAAAVHRAVEDGPWLLANGGLRGAVRRTWHLERFGCFLGGSGGEGLGYGVGASIGAALAHRDDDHLVVDLQTDGDLLYAPSAFWTAAQQRLPLLTVVSNNRSYGRDRTHQTVIAEQRGRPVENAAVGIDIEDPAIDIGALAASQGVECLGRVEAVEDLAPTLARAARVVRTERRPVIVDVVVERRP
jgi:benzoylformate decarboxylase/acetolactate synthase-1/2/3 large subunit